LQIGEKTSTLLSKAAQSECRQERKDENTNDIIPIEQFKSPGFSSQFLCIGPRAPAKHSDDAENNSKWIVLDDEHGGRFYW